MAQNYSAIPLSAKIAEEYFASDDRLPAYNDRTITWEVVEKTLKSMDGVSYRFHPDGIHLDVTTSDDQYTEMSLSGLMRAGDLSFRGGHEELIRGILQECAKAVGPLALFFGSGEDPIIFDETGQSRTRHCT